MRMKFNGDPGYIGSPATWEWDELPPDVEDSGGFQGWNTPQIVPGQDADGEVKEPNG